MLTCCAAAQTDLVIEARTVAGLGDHPVRQDAYPREPHHPRRPM
jgi:hypothetical protein